jgi:hypothetical protein
MFSEPPTVSTVSTVSNFCSSAVKLVHADEELAMRALRKQARVLRTTTFRALKVDLFASSGPLPAPGWVFLLDDGRALAWFGESRPYVVHPDFSALCYMHGLREALVHAA